MKHKNLNDQMRIYLIENYKMVKQIRRVPPPEHICYTLLDRIQKGRCYICRSDGYLLEDHDHETGMVRSLLCRSCNIVEGKRYGGFWKTYRRFPLAGGWFYRYHGYGEQWSYDDPEPLIDRVTIDDLTKEQKKTDESEEEFCNRVSDSYLKKLPNLKTTEKPKIIPRWFLGEYLVIDGDIDKYRKNIKNPTAGLL